MKRALSSYRNLVRSTSRTMRDPLLMLPSNMITIPTPQLIFSKCISTTGSAPESSIYTRKFFTSSKFLQSESFSSNNKTGVTQIGHESLPLLPVPSLNDTLSKYLRSVKPLLTESEYQQTMTVVKIFGADNGIGLKLQSLLEKRAKSCDNWLSDWWLGSAYLEYRSPVLIFSSPGLVFPVENFKSTGDQFRYAAKLIYGALVYKNSIDTKTITLDRMGKTVLDMSQYNKVFGTNRNPGNERDELKYHPMSRHFVIAYKNYFYKVPAYSSDNKILEPNELLKQIHYVVNSTSGLSGIPVGLLTSEHRDTWGRVYEFFRKDKINEASLKVLEQALFLVAIDRPNRPLKSPKGTTSLSSVEDLTLSEKQTVAALQMIHGNRTNSGNRWNDKTIQFVIGCEGECGLTYEHSPAEGPPIANMMDFIVNNVSNFEILLKNFSQGPPSFLPEKLQFNIDQRAINAISEAKENLGKLIDDLDMACFTYKKYGRAFIKNCGFSPDSYIQMAIQSAFHRVHGIPCAHYESASTRIYVGGRTETIRSCSSEALEFSQALNTTGVPSKLKYETMKRAIEGHKNYASEAVRGYGVDRHLLGLKLIAKENGMAIPELFSDMAYIKSTHYRLSTSQVPSMNQAFMCYGPLVADGYGCCYNPRNDEINFGVSAFNSSSETNAENFKICLQEVLLDMQTIAAQNMSAKL